MKVRVIRPIISSRPNVEVEEELKPYASAGTEISAVCLDRGPASVESEYDHTLSSPFVVLRAEEAERDGVDGIVSYCFVDPGVKAAREAVKIPIVGAGEAALTLASLLSDRISVVTILKNLAPLIRHNARAMGLGDRLVSVRAVEIPVLELDDDHNRMEDALFQEMLAAIRSDGAEVLVLGCTGMTEVARNLERRLAAAGPEVPVVDSAVASLKVIEAMVGSGLRHSRLTYMKPTVKRRVL